MPFLDLSGFGVGAVLGTTVGMIVGAAAVMVVLPAFFPVTTPFLETTAMAFFLLVHLQDFTFTDLFFLTFKVTFLPFLTDTPVLFRRTGVFYSIFMTSFST